METRNEKKNENKCGLVDKNYFLKKYNIENKYNKEDFMFIDVLGYGNCSFRAISLQLYGTEEDYDKIRKNVFNFLNANKENYENFNFEYNGNFIPVYEYIDKVYNNTEWIGDLEISALINVYNIIIFEFEIYNENKLILMNRYGDIENNNKILLSLSYIFNNHFQVIYEKNEKDAYKNNI